MRKQNEQKHRVIKESLGIRELCIFQNPWRLLSLLGCVMGNKAGKTDEGQCIEEFGSPDEVECYSVCQEPYS